MPRILSVMMNILYVVEGYIKWLWDLSFNRASKRTKERLELCNKCKENNNGICNLCGCVIKAKVRCTFLEDEDGKTIDGCPLKKW
jgi:hypothetical protein